MVMSPTWRGCTWLRISFWFVAIYMGAGDAWATRFTMNPDGTSYLDIGDAYWQGDWHMAINAYWSPFYSWILGLFLKVLRPSPYWEYPLVHLVNFLIYVAALACFEFFLGNFIRNRRASGKEPGETGEATLPEWAWWALGYSLFVWTSLVMITIGTVTPDMCVAGFVYLSCGVILQIRAGGAPLRAFVLLGVVLGFAYLAKGVMFPLAFVFLAVAMLSLGNLRNAAPRVALSALVFLVITVPFMAAISRAKGRLTFGDSGGLNYATTINGVDSLYPGDSGIFKRPGFPYIEIEGLDIIESPSSKKLLHPVRRIFSTPATYQFDGHVGGTYPFWYDTSYWQEGVKPHFDLRDQADAVIRGIDCYRLLCLHDFRYLTVGLCILFLLAQKRWWFLKRAAANWPLVVPGLVGLSLYAFTHVENRYIAPFVLLLWLAAFSGVRIPRSEGSRRLVAGICIGIATSTIVSAVWYVGQNPTGASCIEPVYWQAAMSLKELGIWPGDKIAVMAKEPVGGSVLFVARLARTQIIAQVNRPDHFFAASPSTQTQVLRAIAASGAKAILTPDEPPHAASGTPWEPLDLTNYYICLLDKGR